MFSVLPLREFIRFFCWMQNSAKPRRPLDQGNQLGLRVRLELAASVHILHCHQTLKSKLEVDTRQRTNAPIYSPNAWPWLLPMTSEMYETELTQSRAFTFSTFVEVDLTRRITNHTAQLGISPFFPQ